MDKTDSQITRELALVVHGGDPTKVERAYEAYQMFSRSAASTVTYRNSTANILARAAYHRSRDLGYTRLSSETVGTRPRFPANSITSQ